MISTSVAISNQPTEARQPGSVCVNCGVCCAGVMFGAALLHSEEEREKALQFELTVLTRRGTGEPLFRLPCHYLSGSSCSIYETRFDTCRSYECDLVQDLRSGEVSYSRADEIVAQVRQRIADLERQLPPAMNGENLWQRIRAFVGEEHEALDERTRRQLLLQKARALDYLVRTHLESTLTTGIDQLHAPPPPAAPALRPTV